MNPLALRPAAPAESTNAETEIPAIASKHINAKPGDFADTVLMPGDPLRAQYIADHYLQSARRVTDVRNMWGFTGEYDGMPVSLLAHGMGIPSASIYWSELIETYGVKRIMRVGSCGTSHPDVKLRDVVIAMGACTDSGVNRMRFGGFDYAPIATWSLLKHAVEAAEASGARFHVGNVFSADLFYTPQSDMFETMARYDVLGIEMEAAGLYPLAAEHRVEALAICTVSDDIPSGDALTSEERATTFDDMIGIALETARRAG
ncbi:MAG: purine-nucleoside phosphorylase [Woeseiaceae bacterium]|nr:purine-nucleoside phosphorylase [Woeseiaceae bacterium]